MSSFSDNRLPLYVFNCSHELAMANGHKNYYPPGNVRLMERELAPIAALLAPPGSAVLVAEEDKARCREFFDEDIHFVSLSDLSGQAVDLHPWGLDSHIVWQLQKAGATLLSDATACQAVAELTSRRTAVNVLNQMVRHQALPLCGASVFCETYREAAEAVSRWPQTILKAPISSSGRGLRYAAGVLAPPLSGWTQRVIEEQGGVVVEPFYQKLCDLAAEFWVQGHRVEYLGLSGFRSDARCAYAGNLIASQAHLRHILLSDLAPAVFDAVVEDLTDRLSQALGERYTGPAGVDMMLCWVDNAVKLHPCVEINLRTTMGHIALKLAGRIPEGETALFQLLYDANPEVLQAKLRQLDGQLLIPAPAGFHYAAVLCRDTTH